MNLFKSSICGLGQYMRKAARPLGSMESSNPRRWRGKGLHHHGGEVHCMFVLLWMDSWCHKLKVCTKWYKNNLKMRLMMSQSVPPRLTPHLEMVSQEPAASWRFFNASDRFTTAMVSTWHFLGSPFCLMSRRTAAMCTRYSLLFPREYMGILRWDAFGSLILKIWGSSLGMTMSTTGMYGMGGRWDSCPFLHSASFNPSGDLREVLILAYCQSPVPSRSFSK